ncbi:hypothetical protein Patl1_06650 [Pistacia atlantica]|uniref:Uncharacterized protein n=1 Tax=Pistacia atlantica TaxID=434234 RepID=A0ACC1BV09_9ROSI|nr:hypothetical protein Patl1_06650 [Pistacia atlantica]
MSYTASIFQQNNHHQPRLLFSFTPKATPFHSLNSLRFDKKPLLSSSSSQHQQSCSSITHVSTAPVEYAPPAPDFNFHQEISRLRKLMSQLSVSKSLKQKISVLDADSRVKQLFNSSNNHNYLARVLGSLTLGSYQLFLIKCLIAAGQEHVLNLGGEFVESEVNSGRNDMKSALYALVEMIERWDVNTTHQNVGFVVRNGFVLENEKVKDLNKLLKSLAEIEQFYDCIGGIIGYQVKVLELLAQSKFEEQTMGRIQHINESMECQFLEVHVPSGLDLSQNTEYASQAALWGIKGLPELGEIYPLGGSADRLGLVDPHTGECLPAAMLPYCGRTLLEGLIRDLQAREYLYFKMYGKQCITPVAIMTSAAKNNHERISSICERLGWFGRGQSSFRLFEQPLVPAVSAEDGQWLVMRPFVPVCKPGGHGAIWKLASDKGVFKWFSDHGRKGATVRQVSNVVAATDLTLLALAGIGIHHGKKLGFASCKRSLGATEGINVQLEKKNLDGKWAYGLSCIEYTEFDKFGITGGPLSSNSLQAFPANTNILYVDLASAELVGSSNSEKSLPGMVLNIKKPIVYVDQFGDCHSVSGGRLECTMQNIADNFSNAYSSRCYKDIEDQLDTFMVYNERRRVTSSAKKKRKHADMSLHQCSILSMKQFLLLIASPMLFPSFPMLIFQVLTLLQTPEGSLLDILRNAYDILSQCNIKLPEIESNDKYIDSGPPYLILLHPALGVLWEVTRQKFNGGSISMGSELQIEVAEFLWKNVQLDGSLIILAENVMGSTQINKNGESILQYGHRCGRCRLHNVKVLNKGIDWGCGDNTYWKHDVQRFEALKIILHGNAEFEATDVTLPGNRTCNKRPWQNPLYGNHVFEVPDGHKLKITSGNSGLAIQLDPIKQDMMDSGSWYWNYKISGTDILLEMIES